MTTNSYTRELQVDFSIDNLRRHVRGTVTEPSPVIGISCNHNHVDENTLTHTYVDSVRLSGGTPLLIPMTTDLSSIRQMLLRCHGLILSGGGDAHPLWSGDPDMGKQGQVDTAKDYFDYALIETAIELNIPILGICRGMQLLTVALGGKLFQDLPSEKPGSIGHMQTSSRYELSHRVQITEEGRLRGIFGTEEVLVNSFHHQAVKIIPDCATTCAISEDGVVEALDFYPEYNALGVQWHPEALACDARQPHDKLFNFIVQEAKLYERARCLHRHAIAVDSHTDTPMIFGGQAESYDFGVPATRALVDEPRMINGGLDACVMVAYIPQGELSDEARRKAYDYTDQTLRDIDTVMQRCPHIRVVTADSMDVRKGHRYIIKGIENGYAIGQDISLLKHFKTLGVKYITLCHNGDNDICDSASKSKKTHGGLSDFGREVIREMNRLGITIDVSHAGDQTIRDILELSSQPVVASHSSCRVLCNHPRNLPDDLIRAIADKGGVVQACMYKGFVREQADQATILDFIDHILHIRSLVGANHVGIGTDFDGDGEVIGCRHTGQFIRITIELLRSGVPEDEVKMILGENFLRILSCNHI